MKSVDEILDEIEADMKQSKKIFIELKKSLKDTENKETINAIQEELF